MRRLPSRTVFTALVLFIFAAVFPARGVPPTDTDRAMKNIAYLSAPEPFEGRKSGSPGGTLAKDWIADRFAMWGLEPLIGNDLKVPFEMLYTENKEANLTLLDGEYPGTSFLFGDDFTLCTNSGSGDIIAPVVLVGHGISKPEKGWDDYGDIDVSGRIVIIFRGKPESKEDWEDENSRSYLFPEAVNRGAAGVFFFDRDFPINGAAIMADAYREYVPAGYIGSRVLRHLLHGSGYTLEAYKRKLKEGPFPLPLEQTLHFEARVKVVPDSRGINVVGLVPGSDPRLAGEAVIIGAHGDHVGKNAAGRVFCGADDNASGAGTVMELARAFALEPQPRTMIFCIFGGEEQGLLGSTALASSLPDKYVYVNMVNLDMVGRGEGKLGLGGGDMLAEVWDPWWDSLSVEVREMYSSTRAWGGSSSDHAPFRERGIPAFTGYSQGNHDYYHTTDDRFYTIQRPAIEGALKGTALWITAIASYPGPLADSGLSERTIWHRGTPLNWTGPIEASDLASTVGRSLRAGFTGCVVELPLSAEAITLDDAVPLFRRYLDAVKTDNSSALAKSLNDLPGNSYQRTCSVFPAINADRLSPADTLLVRTLAPLGAGWFFFENPDLWLGNIGPLPERKALLDAILENGTIIQIPLSRAAEWVTAKTGQAAISTESLNKVTFTGDWSDFALTPDTLLATLRDNGSGIIVLLSAAEAEDAVAQAERIARFKVHIQPRESSYPDALKWVTALRNAGLDKDEIVRWIGGNMRLW